MVHYWEETMIEFDTSILEALERLSKADLETFLGEAAVNGVISKFKMMENAVAIWPSDSEVEGFSVFRLLNEGV